MDNGVHFLDFWALVFVLCNGRFELFARDYNLFHVCVEAKSQDFDLSKVRIFVSLLHNRHVATLVYISWIGIEIILSHLNWLCFFKGNGWVIHEHFLKRRKYLYFDVNKKVILNFASKLKPSKLLLWEFEHIPSVSGITFQV